MMSLAPTIILIYLDDAGYGDFGFTGHPTIETPRIDRMAQEGAVATQYYSVSPACTASRYSLLTGKYPSQSGFDWVLGPDSPRYLHPRETTIAEMLKAKGYETMIAGKWHLGTPNRRNDLSLDAFPMRHGFDRWFGISYSNDMRPTGWPDLPLYQSRGKDLPPRLVDRNPDVGTLQRRLTESAVSFLKEPSSAPKFLYFANPFPHVPLGASVRFAGTSRRGAYGDVMAEVDWSVGELLDAVKDQNAIVILTSDNGPWILKGLDGGSAGLFRDGKGSTWEGGVREPFVIYSPGRIDPGTRMSVPFASVDLYSQLDRWASAEPAKIALSMPKERPIGLFGIGNKLAAVRRGPWKLHLSTYSQLGEKYFTDPMPLLFNVETDPSETRNLAGQRPDLVLSLMADARELESKTNLSYWTP